MQELTTSPNRDVHGDQIASGPDPDDSVSDQPILQSGTTHLDVEMDSVHIRGPSPDICEESNPNISGVDILEPEPHGSQAEEMQLEPESIPMKQNTGPSPDDPELQVIQDPVTIFCDRLQSAVQSLKYEATPAVTGRVLQTLIKIIGYVFG